MMCYVHLLRDIMVAISVKNRVLLLESRWRLGIGSADAGCSEGVYFYTYDRVSAAVSNRNARAHVHCGMCLRLLSYSSLMVLWFVAVASNA